MELDGGLQELYEVSTQRRSNDMELDRTIRDANSEDISYEK